MGLNKEDFEKMQEKLSELQERLGIEDELPVKSEVPKQEENGDNDEGISPEKLKELIKSGEFMKNKDTSPGGKGILDAFSDILGKGLTGETQTPEVQKPIDMNSYFSENMLKDKITVDDIITISHKENDGYKAAFITIGDLIKFIKLQIGKSN
jgi:hypothetical protein